MIIACRAQTFPRPCGKGDNTIHWSFSHKLSAAKANLASCGLSAGTGRRTVGRCIEPTSLALLICCDGTKKRQNNIPPFEFASAMLLEAAPSCQRAMSSLSCGLHFQGCNRCEISMTLLSLQSPPFHWAQDGKIRGDCAQSQMQHLVTVSF